jgi:putative hydrolase of the HAD superfamily
VDNEGHRLSYERERDWWKFLVREVFSRHITFQDFEAFFDYLYIRFAEADCWRLYEEVPEILQSLKSKGLRMAIVSNWDSRLPSLCEKLAIDSYFETMVISSIVGYEKPHPSIFRIALERTGLQPHDVLYVGDDPFLDYQAARKVGITALHLDRYGRFPDHQDKITTLHELLLRAL